MKIASFLVGAFLLTTVGMSPVGVVYAANGQMTKHTFSNDAGTRDYYVYLPQGARARGPMPLMVMLHGCGQNAQGFADSTGMNAVADKHGFAVLYPEQPSSANSMSCWNWFNAENQTRGGELSIVAGMVEELGKTVTLDPNKIYAAGLSSGGAMASNLVACYSDVFSGAGIHAGLAYKAGMLDMSGWLTSANPAQTGVDAAHCSGAQVNPVAIAVFHGSSDYMVGVKNSDTIVKQFSKMNDILDDGEDNDSQSSKAISTERGQVQGGRSYEVSLYGGNDKVLIEKVLVSGMSHAWSGGKSGNFADPKGPDASEMTWEFLSTHSMPRNK